MSLSLAGITLHFLHICFIGFSNVNVFQIPRRYYIYLLLTTKLMMIVVYMAKMIALTATIYTDPLSSSLVDTVSLYEIMVQRRKITTPRTPKMKSRF